MAEYNASAIHEYSNLDHIRARPTAYIRTRDAAGVIHTIRENIDNSIDELTQIKDGESQPKGGTIYVCLFKDLAHNRFQILVKDDGRGIPSSKLKSVMSVVGASGKIGKDTAYVASGGQFGIGAKVASALSSKYRAITKNYVEDTVGELSMIDGKIITNEIIQMNYSSGVTVVFELDVQQFFQEALDFVETGSLDIIKLCRQLNMFNDCIDFEVYVYERKLPADFWVCPIPQALGIIDDYLFRKKKEVVYSSLAVVDKTRYLFEEYWSSNSPVYFNDTYFVRNLAKGINLREYTVKLFLTKKSATGSVQCFAAMNNVVLKYRANNSISVVTLKLLRNIFAKYQENEQYRKFVLEEYKFPTMMLAMDVRYNGAELAGVTKDDYHDETFEKEYGASLSAVFESKGDEYWAALAQNLKVDIELRYAQTYDVPVKKTDGRKTFLELNFVNNFKECEVYDERSELYLVEGNSAAGIVNSRDSNFQAIYTTRGKPLNGASQYGSLTADREKLLKNPLYQDLMRIIGVTPRTTDINTAKIKKIIIATDADPDGYHIAALHLNNFAIINPLIVESGMVWIAKPPLYSLVLANGRQSIFLRDKAALYDKRIEMLYSRNLLLEMNTSAGIIPLDPATYRETCYLIHYLGEVFSRVAVQMNLPLLILERLIYAIEYIYPKVDIVNLARCFESNIPGYARVSAYDNYLVISIGEKDHVIGLQDLGRMLADSILHLVNKYRYNELFFNVRPRQPDGSWGAPVPMSGMMLYTVMIQLDEKLNIERYKGLGQMPADACYTTIMNPSTRAVVQVRNLGDLEASYAVIGTADSEPRKQLLSGSSVLSNSFFREQALTSFEDQ